MHQRQRIGSFIIYIELTNDPTSTHWVIHNLDKMIRCQRVGPFIIHTELTNELTSTYWVIHKIYSTNK